LHELSVLLLEDHPIQRAAAAAILEEIGVGEVLEAGDGAEAMELLSSRALPVDIVFCDLMMDGMDGIEFIRHLSEQKLASTVVLASALNEEVLQTVETMAANVGLTVLGRLAKPLHQAELRTLLERYRQQKQHHPPAPYRASPQRSLEEIQEALAQKQFTLWFQPKVSIETRALVGVEALVRWQHPKDGIIFPGAFIPAMEASGLIHPLTEQVLELSLAFARRQLDIGRSLKISFNLSASSLFDTDIPSRFRSLAQRYNVPTRLLVAEVTETAVEENLASVLEILTRLRIYGFGLSIDDFGTGYSSIQKLSRIPFTELKIDRSFVDKADVRPKNQAILRSMMQLARDLELETVAEGVETEMEWNLLAALGCQLVQGYYIAKPMSEAALMQWAEAR
jgi:EAL domain-containing protein (putative c-di-GMP-specific phosphodiesterase class I)/AmiR/NasT family two-component response regulator